MKAGADTRHDTSRKNLKPQIERYRRERMNRSLDHLRDILIQQHPLGLSGSRLEKAEILESAVQFIQMKVSEKAEFERGAFQGGFSACLHKAAEFLRAEGETRRADLTTSTALYHQLSSHTASGPSLNSHEWSLHHLSVAHRDARFPKHGGTLTWHESPQIPTVDHREPSASTQNKPVWRPWP